ncbi:ABC1 atypical kinase-like domain-containing protein OS=Streptomyces antimycoticus OX=68175 GN=SANT12839_062200 PE=4 SV=1 [Streptomyces antimycoticus]
MGATTGCAGRGSLKPTIEMDPDDLLDCLLPMLDRPRSTRSLSTGSGCAARRRGWPILPVYELGNQLNLPPAYLLIHRVTLSTIGVLCQLGATVRLRDELEAWVPGFAQDPEPEDGAEEGAEAEEGTGTGEATEAGEATGTGEAPEAAQGAEEKSEAAETSA